MLLFVWVQVVWIKIKGDMICGGGGFAEEYRGGELKYRGKNTWQGEGIF